MDQQDYVYSPLILAGDESSFDIWLEKDMEYLLDRRYFTLLYMNLSSDIRSFPVQACQLQLLEDELHPVGNRPILAFGNYSPEANGNFLMLQKVVPVSLQDHSLLTGQLESILDECSTESWGSAARKLHLPSSMNSVHLKFKLLRQKNRAKITDPSKMMQFAYSFKME